MITRFVRSSAVVVALGAATPLLSQTVVTGTARDDRNALLAGVTVVVRGSHSGVMTNESGWYRLVVPAILRDSSDSLTLIARRIGFEASSRRVAIARIAEPVDFVLKASMLKLESVMVTSADASMPSSSKERSRATRSMAAADEARAPAAVAERAASGADGRRAGDRGVSRQDPSPGVLTAASWDDAQHWRQYSRFLDRARKNSWNPWGLDVGQSNVRQVRRDGRQRSPRRALEVGFLVDATGSMGDEMTYLQSELKDIVRRVRAVEPDLDVRVSVVFYRDRGDDFITKSLPFTRRVDEAVSFIAGTSAGGGGDFPEDMNAGLEAMMQQSWSRDAVPQMLFLLADAPPQQYAGTDYTYHEAIQDAAAHGIAIYPVAASGVDKPTEFLFRAMAVMTGGKYVFLTDDSGVGNPHAEPDISGYTVEKLNDLMVREIRSYVAARVGGRRVAGAR